MEGRDEIRIESDDQEDEEGQQSGDNGSEDRVRSRTESLPRIAIDRQQRRDHEEEPERECEQRQEDVRETAEVVAPQAEEQDDREDRERRPEAEHEIEAVDRGMRVAPRPGVAGRHCAPLHDDGERDRADREFRDRDVEQEENPDRNAVAQPWESGRRYLQRDHAVERHAAHP